MSATLSFGRWLKQHRKAVLKLTQEELARRVGCAVTTIRKIEADLRCPSEQIAARLADHVGLTPEQHTAFVPFARTGSGAELFNRVAQGADLPTHPPALSVAATLPVPLTPLIGRAHDLASVEEYLVHSDIRLLTLTGAPGIGKTRLSLQVAANLQCHFHDGVLFVTLASVSDPTLVPLAIAQVLTLSESAGLALADRLRAFLRDRQMLLVLDNFEQVVGAAPFVTSLLAAAPLLKVLVTSRAALHVYGEHEFAVPPLAAPHQGHQHSLATIAHYPAVELFVRRAQAVKPAFQLTAANAAAVASISARLDGLPLAIELAAARIKLLSPQALLERLDQRFALLTDGPQDLPPRQRSLRATIDWSFGLLSPAEQQLCALLAVFSGGCSLEAATAVCDTAHNAPELLRQVSSLLNQSLLWLSDGTDGEVRFMMLETIREYALLTLAPEAAAAARQRHGAYYLQLAEDAEPELHGAQQTHWLRRLELEFDNLRATFRWASEHKNAEMALRLCSALWQFWETRGYLSEGREWIEAAVALERASGAPLLGWLHLRARALRAAGALSHDQGDYERADYYFRKSLSLSQVLEDQAGIADALNDLGVLARSRGDYGQATALYEASLAIARELQDHARVATSLNTLGNIAHLQGDYQRATAFMEESLQLRRALGDTRAIAWSLKNLGGLAREQGIYALALAYYEESLALFRQVEDQIGIAYTLASLGMLARADGQLEQAGTLYDEGLGLLRQCGDKWGIAMQLNHLGDIARLRGDVAAAQALCSESLGIFRSLENSWGIAWSLSNLGDSTRDQGDLLLAQAHYNESLLLRIDLGDKSGVVYDLEGLASIAHLAGHPQRAVRLFGAAEALREQLHMVYSPSEQSEQQHYVDALRAQLDTGLFLQQWAAGKALAYEEASAFALREM